ncbi:MAG: hypothetical protein ACE5K0_07225 [Candidatus Methanofastidiosia archaeon]
MSIVYEKIEKLESTLQTLRANLLKARKELFEVKRKFRDEKEFEELVSEASKVVERGEDVDPTKLIREMRERDYDW